MSLSRDAILGCNTTDVSKVSVKEFGGDVCVATLTAAEADRIKEAGSNGMPSNVFLVILGACDDKGVRLFTDADAEILAKKPARALTRIANKVLQHNGMTDDEGEAKNASSETLSDDSASVSP
jgi:hypothetical protein